MGNETASLVKLDKRERKVLGKDFNMQFSLAVRQSEGKLFLLHVSVMKFERCVKTKNGMMKLLMWW